MKNSPNLLLSCFECENGRLLPVTRTYHITIPNEEQVPIHDVPMYCCDLCGDLLTDGKGDEVIQLALNKIPSLVPR